MNATTHTHVGAALVADVRAETDRLLRRLLIAVQRVVDGWRQYRRAAEMRAALHSLDAHTLRDLGFHRSEIDSVVAEFVGGAESTRAPSQRPLR